MPPRHVLARRRCKHAATTTYSPSKVFHSMVLQCARAPCTTRTARWHSASVMFQQGKTSKVTRAAARTKRSPSIEQWNGWHDFLQPLSSTECDRCMFSVALHDDVGFAPGRTLVHINSNIVKMIIKGSMLVSIQLQDKRQRRIQSYLIFYLFIYFVYICPAIELVLMCG
jgi:hypothetical protein